MNLLRTFLLWLIPARYLKSDVPVFADLDRMISEPVGIRYNGRVHQIKPMKNEVFLLTVNELAALEMMRLNKTAISRDQVEIQYFKCFSRCCDSITLKDVRNMTDGQKGAFLTQIIECVTGTAHGDASKKKTLINHTLQNA